MRLKDCKIGDKIKVAISDNQEYFMYDEDGSRVRRGKFIVCTVLETAYGSTSLGWVPQDKKLLYYQVPPLPHHKKRFPKLSYYTMINNDVQCELVSSIESSSVPFMLSCLLTGFALSSLGQNKSSEIKVKQIAND